MKLFDSHAHLEEIPDLEESIKKSKEMGIVGIIAVGSDPESNEEIFKIAKRYEKYIFPSIGLHPWDLSHENAERGLIYLSKNCNKAIAIGEVGLDYRIKLEKDFQIKVFEKVLEIAKKSKKPVIIHARDAWRDALRLVLKIGLEKAIFHWYSGPLDVLSQIIENGYYISATPAATYQEKHRRAIKQAPISRILLESDTPVIYRGLESRPYHVILSAKGVAELKKLPIEEVARKCLKNVEDVFEISINFE